MDHILPIHNRRKHEENSNARKHTYPNKKPPPADRLFCPCHRHALALWPPGRCHLLFRSAHCAGPFEILVASPLLAALIVTAIASGKAGIKNLLRKFTQWRVGWGWYAVALLLPPTISLIAAYLNVLWGAPLPTLALFGSASNLLLTFALRLINPWDGPLMEELGWRGFALPRLQERYTALNANLILAGLVMIWHLRYVFSGDLPRLALVGTLAATILFGWLYANTRGSLLLVFLFHAADGVLKPTYTGIDSTHYLWLQIAVWCVMTLGVVIYYGPTLVRRSATQTQIAPIGAPLTAK
jgi:uncharacterized protein